MNNPETILWDSTEAAVLTGGINTAPWRASGVCIRAVDIRPGDLFFASPDDDLDAVFCKGAAAAVVAPGMHASENWPAMVVPDVFEALRALARAARFRTHALVLAVQGRAEREHMQRFLGAVAGTHAGGRHMSQAMAGLPEDCEYAVFGFSPSVRPDIAVITDCAAALNSTVIEAMPDNGIVLVPADDPRALDVLARARAAGVRSLFTFGRSAGADAAAHECLPASNGRRLGARVLGEDISFFLPAGTSYTPCLLAALLVLKLSGVSLARAAGNLAAVMPAGARTDSNVSLMDAARAHQGRGLLEAVFQVKNLIDWGGPRRTLVIDRYTGAAQTPQIMANKDLEIPGKIDTLDIVCAGRGLSVFPDAQAAIRSGKKPSRVEEIVPDVLTPGDYLVFRKMRQASRAVFSRALRIISDSPGGHLKSDHAL